MVSVVLVWDGGCLCGGVCGVSMGGGCLCGGVCGVSMGCGVFVWWAV